MPRLKSWESPRRQGRNNKGKGGSARKRQLKKRLQMLRNKLKSNQTESKADKKINGNIDREEINFSSFFYGFW